MNGQVSVTSDVGQGTTFTIRFKAISKDFTRGTFQKPLVKSKRELHCLIVNDEPFLLIAYEQ